jgi:beta-galactosidase
MRYTSTLDRGWRFQRGDSADAAAADFDDGAWEGVTVPHDWAIAGPFSREHDVQITYIEQDGQWEEDEHIARTGGLPHVGTAWYRRRFRLPPDAAADARAFLEFDGVMSHATVFVNGVEVGGWAYGYASFILEATSAICRDRENTVAVRVDNPPFASRWYPGAGIYRHARLVVTDAVRIATWGVTVTIPELADDRAHVRVHTEIDGADHDEARRELQIALSDEHGHPVADATVLVHGSNATVDLDVPDPVRWHVGAPHLYTAHVRLLANGVESDAVMTPFGIRACCWDAERGFLLNGRVVPLKGVCMHHDYGPLGAAQNQRAMERQWDILQDMGCNALRTSHNPPAPELLALCDRRGILVIDEIFDEWRQRKVGNGYHSLFDGWAERDLRSFIRRDRNHPCVIAWSLGNEIPEQHDPACQETARWLKAICREEDPTRPVTAGCNLGQDEEMPLLAEMDVAGMNYQAVRYGKYREAHPEQPLYGSETASCISSRGVYAFPVSMARGEAAKLPTHEVPSYDLTLPAWGNLPDTVFANIADTPGVAGEFVWTGFDYLGEPSPFYKEWPVRSSHFGIIDLCGIPKDRFYLYRAHWNTDVFTLHLLPHWTWPGREGEVTPVHCYTSAPAAELFVNGVSQGVRRKDPSSEFDRYRLRWNDVVYQPGTLAVAALDSSGSTIGTHTVQTAGAPAALELLPDRRAIAADGCDLSFITVRAVDAAGTPCPTADSMLDIRIEGAGELAAVGNGSAVSDRSFRSPRYPLYNGMATVIVRGTPGQSGQIDVALTATGLPTAATEIQSCCATACPTDRLPSCKNSLGDE